MSALQNTNNPVAIIRMKRHINEEPLDAFVLNCKRRKTDSDSGSAQGSDSATVLKFAGTVNEVSTRKILWWDEIGKRDGLIPVS